MRRRAIAPVLVLAAVLVVAGLPMQGASAAPSQCQGETVTISGTSGDDKIIGTEGRDVIHAGGGNDAVRGRDGNDVLCGGGGNDNIFGDDDDDLLSGGAGVERATWARSY